jgi:hypothetical protein|uniref:Uncharacterized protein n=1 Tax=viral metagenome TaxID=1070528 RepID=A0A6C0DWK5_9ZZZZ
MTSETEKQLTLPPASIWNQIAKISITEDKPIMLDYWLDSLEKKVLIGVKENKEKLLVKNAEEYTSPISKIYKMDETYIICTENSIYLTSTKIETRRISS